jgi:hypothetical protein
MRKSFLLLTALVSLTITSCKADNPTFHVGDKVRVVPDTTVYTDRILNFQGSDVSKFLERIGAYPSAFHVSQFAEATVVSIDPDAIHIQVKDRNDPTAAIIMGRVDPSRLAPGW